MATNQAPAQITGGGFLFFNDLLVCSITRVERSSSNAEAVGRYKGDVVNVSHGNKDHFLRVHAEDLTADVYAVLSGRCEAFTSLAASRAAQQGSVTFQHVESLTLTDSLTAATLNTAGATGIEVFKRDLSVKYTQATDFTATTSAITRIGTGSIASGQHVFVSYKHVDATAIYAQLGKGVGPLRGQVRVVIVDQGTGKLFMFEHTKAVCIGDLALAIEHGADWGGSDLEFRLIKDLDSDHPYGKMAFGSTAVKSVTS